MEKNSSTFPLMLMGVLARAHIDISEDFRPMCHEGGGHGNRKIIFSIFSPFQAILCTFHYLRKKLLKMPHSGPWGGCCCSRTVPLVGWGSSLCGVHVLDPLLRLLST